MTVSEPDGSNPEMRTATYGKAIISGLQVGKGSISPTINLEEGDTLTGTSSFTNGENAVETHVWELDGVEVQRGYTRGLSSTYVAGAGQVRYRMEVVDDNNNSAVVGEWSEAATVIEAYDPTVPNADMNTHIGSCKKRNKGKTLKQRQAMLQRKQQKL